MAKKKKTVLATCEETKNDGDLIAIMYKHLKRQEEIAETKWNSAMEKEECGELELKTNRRSKKENIDLKEYNAQVSAIGKTISAILSINRAGKVALVDNEEEEIEDLV